MGKISYELDILISILEDQESLFDKRIQFIKQGEWGKVKFIDEKIEPILIQKHNKQALEVTKAFRQRLGDKYERCKRQTQAI